MKITAKEKEVLEEKFNISEDDNIIELESWTDGGVDMLISLDKRSYDDIIQALKFYVDNFDIDEEIELYREGKEYKEHFTIRQSLEDFEDYINSINDVINDLKELNEDDEIEILDEYEEPLETLKGVGVQGKGNGVEIIIIGMTRGTLAKFNVAINLNNYEGDELANICYNISLGVKELYYRNNGEMSLEEVKEEVKRALIKGGMPNA